MEKQTITPQELKGRIGETLVLDVRGPEEYLEAHIPGSVLYPLEEVDASAARLIAASGRPVALVCESGGRARLAAERLEAAGLSGGCILDGGMAAWKAAGGGIRGRGARISLERQIRIAAGSFVIVGFLLAYAVNPWWLALSAFVGCGLVFAGVTGFCGMGVILSKMPWNRA